MIKLIIAFIADPKDAFRLYLKSFCKKDRDFRIHFLGKRHKARQAQWLYFSNHPWEVK